MRVSSRGSETEASSDSDPKLPPPMAGVTGDQLPQPVGMLEVVLTWPKMSGYAGPAWPRFCNIYVGVGGEVISSKTLPSEMEVEVVDDEDISEQEIRRHVRSRAMEDVKRWRLAFRIPVRLGWPHESLDILVERIDYDPRWKNPVVVTRGGPHTSGYTVVIGRARVRLLDALVDGDEDEEEAEDKKKRRRNELDTKLEGTVEFGKTVPLLVWGMPPLGDVDRKPRSVVRGTVDVRMCLRRPGRA